MNYSKKKILNRIWAMCLAVIMTIAVLPGNVFAIENAESTNYATVTTLTGGTVDGSATANVNVTVEETTLQWVAADTTIGRNEDGWWAGMQVTAPEGFSEDASLMKKEGSTSEYAPEAAMKFTEVCDGEDFVGIWLLVTPEILSEGNDIINMYTFDWDADGTYEQEITFTVKPSDKIVLMNGEEQVYPTVDLNVSNFATVTALTGGEVEGSGTSNVAFTVEETTLQWVAADTTIGRNEDGWWAGMQVTAPEGFSEDASLMKKEGSTSAYAPEAAMKFTEVCDGEDFVGVWLLVTPEALLEGNDIVNMYTFDWNADGTYEQEITFTVKPSDKIVLMKGEEQVYPNLPKYAEVTALTGGTVENSGTDKVAVTIEETTLQWVEADDTLGRAEGWWIGINVTAPKYYDAEAKLMLKKGTDTNYDATKAMNFVDVRDGEDYVGIWFSVSPEALVENLSVGTDIVNNCAFDWNADTEYGQEITVTVKPSDKIVLMKGEEQIYPVDTTKITIEGYSRAYDKMAHAPVIEAEGYTVKYSEDNVVYTEVAPTITNVGEKLVYVQLYKEGYLVYKKEVTLRVTPAELNLDGLKVTALDSVYTGEEQNSVTIENKGDYDLKYQLSDSYLTPDESAWQAEIPTVTDAGQYIVWVKAVKENYNDSDVDVEPAVNAVAPYNVFVEKAEQKDVAGFDNFAFTISNPNALAYNDTFENLAIGGVTGGAITYEVAEGNEYVTVDATTGIVTAIKAGGTATIKATLAGNDNYKEVSATYTINTIKAEQTGFAFFATGTYNVQYGTKELTIAAVGGQSGGTVTYEVIEGTEIASVTSNNNEGNISFASGKKGSVKIRATLAGNDNYEPITAETIVTVKTNDFSTKYAVTQCPTTGWYIDDVTLTPADGYKIAKSGEFDAVWLDSITIATEGENKPTVYLKETATGYISEAINPTAIYIDKTNPVDLEISYSTSILDILDVVLNVITFGYYNAEMEVTLSASDMISGIDHFVYQVGANTAVTVEKAALTMDGNKATYTFKIPANAAENIVTFTAFDTAARETTVVGSRKIVVDNVKPNITVTYDNNEVSHESYFKAPRTATITIDEANFPVDRLYEKVTISGEEQNYNYLTITVTKKVGYEEIVTYTEKPNFNYENGVYTAEVKFVEDADYTFDIEFYDYASNKNAEVDYGKSKAPKAFTVDTTDPVISISYDDTNATVSTSNEGYYSGKREFIIEVNEHNFKPEELDFTGSTALDVTGSASEGSELADMIAHFQNAESWKPKDSDVKTASYTIKDDANYNIVLNYSDLADRAIAKTKTSQFCLDNTAPINEKVTYSTPILELILKKVLFGFYDAKQAIVTMTVDDITAGVDYFTYSYTVTEGGHKDDLGMANVVVPKKDITFSADGKTATAEFKIPAQFRGYVTFTATDMVGDPEKSVTELKDENHILVVDSEEPVVTVEYDDVANDNVAKNGNYHSKTRTATISISADNFFPDELYKPIMDKGEKVQPEENYLVITVGTRHTGDEEFTYTNPTPEFTYDAKTNTYQATVKFDELDAEYTFDVKYTDKSLNVFDKYEMDQFYVDQTAPNPELMDITITPIKDGGSKGTTSSVKETKNTFAYDVFSVDKVQIDFSANCDISGLKSLKYQKVLNLSEYKENENWVMYDDNTVLEVEPTDRFVIYLRAEDKAGNVTIVRSTGIVVDDKKPEGEQKAPEIDIIPAQGNDCNIHSSDMTVDLKVLDPIYKGTALDPNGYYSGLKEIIYNIYEHAGDTVPKETGVLFSYKVENGEVSTSDNKYYAGNYQFDAEKLVKEWAGTITVHAEVEGRTLDTGLQTFNSNSIIVEIVAVDNAGNKRITTTTAGAIKIDTTPPEVTVVYDNNYVDSGMFFCAPRRAKITIKERNFDPNDVYAVVNGQKLEWLTETPVNLVTNEKTYYDPLNWSAAGDYYWYSSDEEGMTPEQYTDERTHTLFVYYINDGSYNFDIGSVEYNANGEPVIDEETKQVKILPFIDMADNKAKNLNEGDSEKDSIYVAYYSTVLQDDGTPIKVPQAAPKFFIIDKTRPVIAISYDNNNSMNEKYYKDVRTATITIYENNLDPNGADANRIWYSMTATEDGQTIPYPSVSYWSSNGGTHTATITYAADGHYTFDIGVRDKAGNQSDDFSEIDFYIDRTAPSLEITGVADNSANAGNVVPVITYSDTNWDPAQVQITLTGANRGNVALDGGYTDIHNGRVFTFRNFAKVQSVDDIYTLTATLTDKAGNTSTQEIHFSVNRFGSTYAMSEETKALNGTYVKEPIDVVVTETNANALEDIKITLFKNNQTIELVEGVDYRINLRGGNGNWYNYTYTIFAKNFADDGVYRLTFHSKDAAGNIAENTLDTKEMEIGFGVDATKPDIVVANIESGVVYALENITVNMSINDNLLLKSIKVYLDDVEIKKWNADEITAIYAENGDFTFDISGDSKSAHEVKVVTEDAAGNESIETISGFFVTTDAWVRYYNNKPLFYGSISGVCLFAGLIIFLIVFLRKRKEEKEQ